MRQTSIHLPQPCSESWAAMTPQGPGRHCASCQDTVVDFTQMSDGEVVVFLAQYPNITCGRFRETQLDRMLLAPAQPVRGWRRWLGATLAMLGAGALLSPKAVAQEDGSGGPRPQVATANGGGSQPGAGLQGPPTAPKTPKSASKKLARSSDQQVEPGHVLLRGVVRNRWGFRQPGARVHLFASPSKPVITDAKGHFQLVVPADRITPGAQLRVRYLNHDRKQYLFTRVPVDSGRTRPYHIRLKKQEIIKGGKFR